MPALNMSHIQPNAAKKRIRVKTKASGPDKHASTDETPPNTSPICCFIEVAIDRNLYVHTCLLWHSMVAQYLPVKKRDNLDLSHCFQALLVCNFYQTRSKSHTGLNFRM